MLQVLKSFFRGTGPRGKGLEGMQEQSIMLGRLRNQDRKTVLLQLMQDRLATMAAVEQVGADGVIKPKFPVARLGGTAGTSGESEALLVED